MNKLFIGDTHLQSGWILHYVKPILKKYSINHVIFIGDYFDQWLHIENDEAYINEIKNLKDFKKYCNELNIDVTFIIGNHDISYLINNLKSYSNFNKKIRFKIKNFLINNGAVFAYKYKDIIISHAGFSDKNEINNQYFESFNNESFDIGYDLDNAISYSRGGYKDGGILWNDLNEDLLKHPNEDIKIQIVGHTPVKTVEKHIIDDKTIYAIDTFSLDSKLRPIGDGSLLALINNEFIKINTNWKNFKISPLLTNFL